jgi:hypothetical protein
MSHNFPGSSYFFRHAIFLVQFLQEIAPVVEANNVPSFKLKKKKKEENVFSSSNFHSKETFSRES